MAIDNGKQEPAYGHVNELHEQLPQAGAHPNYCPIFYIQLNFTHNKPQKKQTFKLRYKHFEFWNQPLKFNSKKVALMH